MCNYHVRGIRYMLHKRRRVAAAATLHRTSSTAAENLPHAAARPRRPIRTILNANTAHCSHRPVASVSQSVRPFQSVHSQLAFNREERGRGREADCEIFAGSSHLRSAGIRVLSGTRRRPSRKRPFLLLFSQREREREREREGRNLVLELCRMPPRGKERRQGQKQGVFNS